MCEGVSVDIRLKCCQVHNKITINQITEKTCDAPGAVHFKARIIHPKCKKDRPSYFLPICEILLTTGHSTKYIIKKYMHEQARCIKMEDWKLKYKIHSF